MKRMHNLVLSFLMVCSLFTCFSPVHAEEETEAETIRISSASELIAFLSNCNYDAWSKNKIFELTTDINLGGMQVTPAAVFAGTFEGNSHTISGLTIEHEMSPAGLFQIITSDGAVENVTVSATVTPEGTQQNVGGIVGINYGTLRRVSFMGTVEGTRNTGGIAGINAATGILSGCSISGVVYGKSVTGGAAGYNLGIVTACENSAYVNNRADDAEINVSDISFSLSLDTQTAVNNESGLITSDTGGIVGYSDGSITFCRNQGTIGYPQFGYNVGGIAGRSDGHILSCTNSGTVQGRKDVGGIVGQAEPFISSSLSASTVSTLSSQLYSLEANLNALQAQAQDAHSAVQNKIDDIHSYAADARSAIETINDNRSAQIDAIDLDGIEDNLRKLEDTDFSDIRNNIDIEDKVSAIRESAFSEIDVLQQIDIKRAGGDLISSMSALSDQSSILEQEIADKADHLLTSARNVSGSIQAMESTLNNALYELQHPEEFIQDTSSQDVDSVLLGKVTLCTNQGTVSGALNTGGIAGAMGLEYTLDPEDDISGQLDATVKKQYELKCILQANTNNGTVNGVRNDIGGIAGRMDMGLILSCENYGEVTSASGSEVGGIAGVTAGVVRSSWSKCHLSGTEAVGGIVGAGTAGTMGGESSTVDNNVAMVEISDYTQSVGAIAGTDTGIFTSNVFVSDDLGGINGASFEGRADPISYEQLKGRELPAGFQSFTLQFVADGEVLKSVEFQYGDSFSEEDFPEIPKKDGMYAVYDRTDLSNLKFDTVVTAVYNNDLTSLSSEEARGSGRSVFYVKGSFNDNDRFIAVPQAHTPQDFDLASDSLWKAIGNYLRSPGKGLAFDQIEQWHLEIPEDGEESHEVRYLLPDTLSGTYQLYLKESDHWKRISPESIGSYAVFAVSGTSADLAVLTAIPGWWIYAFLAYIIVTIVLIVMLQRTRKKRKERREEIRSKIAVDKRLQIGLAFASVFGIAMLGAGFWFIHSGVANSTRAYQLIKEYVSAKPLVMEGNVTMKAGNTDIDETFLLQTDSSDITIITKDDLSLYYYDNAVYLENGTSFRIDSLNPDYSSLLSIAASIYENTSVSAESNGDESIYRLSATQENAEKLLSVLAAEYKDRLPDLKSVDMIVSERNNSLSSIRFESSGVFKDEDKTAYEVSLTLTARDPETASASVPEAVMNAVKSGVVSMNTLSQDYLDLLHAWANLNHSDTVGASIRISGDTDLIHLDDTIQYHHQYNGGNPIRSVQKENMIVYFNDDRMCLEDGSLTTDRMLGKLKNSGNLLKVLYEITMNSQFDVSAAEKTRVFTIRLDETGISSLKDLVSLSEEEYESVFTSGTVQITLSNDSISRITCTLNGSATVLEQEIPLCANVDGTIDLSSEFQIPDKVISALSD